MKVLIVDDSRDDRKILHYIITIHGLDALTASNGQEGLELARKNIPDLIISDVLMPVMDGFQFLRAIKQDESCKSIPFVIYSATYSEQQDIQLAVSLGAEAYLIKPMEPMKLWEEIEGVIEGTKAGKVSAPVLIKEDKEYLKRYSDIIATKLEGKVKELEQTLAARLEAEEKLQWELQLNKSMAKISQTIISRTFTIEDLTDVILAIAMEITRSRHGFVSEIDPGNGDLICHTLTSMIDHGCDMRTKNKPVVFQRRPDGTYPALWGLALNTRKPFYTNAPNEHASSTGIPQGHIAVNNFLAAPALFEEEPLGLIALANGLRDYSDLDMMAISQLAELYTLAIIRLRDESKILNSLREKEVLLKEIHDRVKNNLQIVISLIRMKKEKVSDPELLRHLHDSESRIYSMALIHERLYKSENYAKINFSDYCASLISEIYKMYAVDPGKITCQIDVNSIFLGIDKAIPIGLIINEIVTNSIKYAFPGVFAGKRVIMIAMKVVNGIIEMIISDNGIGIKLNNNQVERESSGLRLVFMIIKKQLTGTVELLQEAGTAYHIQIPIDVNLMKKY